MASPPGSEGPWASHDAIGDSTMPNAGFRASSKQGTQSGGNKTGMCNGDVEVNKQKVIFVVCVCKQGKYIAPAIRR